MHTTDTLKLISWNVNCRSEETASRQIKALVKVAPNVNVVALQDVNPNAVSEYKKQCCLIGLKYSEHTLHGKEDSTDIPIASSFPLALLRRLPSSEIRSQWIQSEHTLKEHWEKRTLFVSINIPLNPLDLYTVYITPYYHTSHNETTRSGKPKDHTLTKLHMLAGVYQELSSSTHNLPILCGDFNTPQAERRNGEVITWGRDEYNESTDEYSLPDSRKKTYDEKKYQDEVELNILCGLGKYHDLPDVYRSVHGYANSGSVDDEAISHVQLPRKWRYDHVFASRALHPLSARYLQNMRKRGLSDHAPIEVVFELTNSITSEARK